MVKTNFDETNNTRSIKIYQPEQCSGGPRPAGTYDVLLHTLGRPCFALIQLHVHVHVHVIDTQQAIPGSSSNHAAF